MLKRKFLFLPGIILVYFILTAFIPPQKQNAIRRVVIDAGHGGHDPGTVGKHAKEKDIALAIALKLGNMIQEKFSDVEVLYTRKTDVFVELYRRSKFANENKADLFISIHCNSTPTVPGPSGIETWVMGLHKSKANLEVAKTENASILMEDNYKNYDGFDPNSPEANIIFSLYQNLYLDQSLAFASKVQKQVHQRYGITDRGVKQAGFWVLYKTTMPGVLVETGFLSNPEDEAMLMTEKGQDHVARSIFYAFADYKSGTESTGDVAANPNESKDDHALTENPKSNRGEDHHRDSVKPAKARQEKPVATKPKKKVEENAVVPENNTSGLIYSVQFLASDKPLSPNSKSFKGVTDVSSYKYKGLLRYVTGKYSTEEEAIKLAQQLQKKGFKDAFVVPFLNGERISLEEAHKMTKK